MYTYFSRFLHYALSHSGIREVFTSSLSLSDLIGVSRSNQLANLFHLDHRVKPDGDRKEMDAPLKPDGDSLCAGRSMVEMLGVLAIIGVLSVGAIAGYSKAMMKYKLNKQAEGLTMLLANCIQLSKQLPAVNEWKIYTDILSKLNLLPDSVSTFVGGGSTLMKDIFGTQSYFYHTSAQNEWGIFYYVPESSFGTEICYNLIKTVKEFHADMSVIARSKNRTASGQEIGNRFYGDNYCNNSDKKCIRNMTMSEIHSFCTDKGDSGEDFNEYYLWLTWLYPEP